MRMLTNHMFLHNNAVLLKCRISLVRHMLMKRLFTWSTDRFRQLGSSAASIFGLLVSLESVQYTPISNAVQTGTWPVAFQPKQSFVLPQSTLHFPKCHSPK